MPNKKMPPKGMAVKKLQVPSTPARYSDDSDETDLEDETQMSSEEMAQRLPSQTSELLILPEDTTEVAAREHSSEEGGNADEGDLTQHSTLFKTDHIHAEDSQLSTQDLEKTEEQGASEDLFHEGQSDAPSKKKRRRSHAQVILPEAVEKTMGEWLEFHAPYFYDKKHPLYRDNKKKREDLRRMGASFDPPICAEDLLQWIITARTKYFFLDFYL